jgi:hypothetical protein
MLNESISILNSRTKIQFDEVLNYKMFKNKTDVLDNQLIFYFKQFDLFYLAKVFGDLIWKSRMINNQYL